MKRIISVFLTAVVLLFVFLPLSAFAEDVRVFDSASLFSETEKAALEQQIAGLRDAKKLDFVIVTTNDAGGKSSQAYADDYYDQNGFGYGDDKSGMLYLIDMDNRQAYISTCGTAIKIYTDQRIDSMLDEVTPELKWANYYNSAKAFLDIANSYSDSGYIYGSEYYDAVTGEVYRKTELKPGEAAAAVFIPLLLCLIFILIVYKKYSRKSKICPYPFQEQSKFDLTKSQDIFLGSFVTSRRIETDNNRGGGGFGGGSSTHTSSGGVSHGGGGRGF